jgi:hypothetical protein
MNSVTRLFLAFRRWSSIAPTEWLSNTLLPDTFKSYVLCHLCADSIVGSESRNQRVYMRIHERTESNRQQ